MRDSLRLFVLPILMLTILGSAACMHDSLDAKKEAADRDGNRVSKACEDSDLSQFETVDGQVVNVPQQLPQGLLLYTSAEMLIEDKGRKGQEPARLLVRELAAAGSEIVCGGGVAPQPFESAVVAPVKIQNSVRSGQTFTPRQFHLFWSKEEQGAVFLKPTLGSKGLSVEQSIKVPGYKSDFFETNDGGYALRLIRESKVQRTVLVIRYELLK